ncbi:NAD-dependent epimerase/dehydratase family protein [Mycolicibacterium fluoranthenivorans]|uniref:UDP-glucose 4-epimerase n=1 Tax=Mycolicibacterium fluoranthenivorans TaxID=258505 RepID=A0A1G4VHZ3_9MYCO|nr:NAD-dependent epimerase/dehydratase family protein [Mycolicibacterium fluoranthenivorans]SCX07081.1 UDP-glucose 4-epimerase [Mycolicibacterium fluoranthenivorans]
MRSFVTGAAGFIGSTLVDRLLAEGHQVIGIDNFAVGAITNLENAITCNETRPGRFRLISLDIQAPELTGIVAGANPDVIFHLAAQIDPQVAVADPQRDARSNILGTINLCEAGRRAGVRRIVYAGCGDGMRADTVSPHMVAKRAGEMYLRAYAEMYGLAPICLALPTIYGPRQNSCAPDNAIAALAAAVIDGHPEAARVDTTRAREYIYVDDVVEALVRAGYASADDAGTYDLSTGRRTTVVELQRLIEAALGGHTSPDVAAGRRGELSATPEPDRRLGWSPAVSLSSGIESTVRWMTEICYPVADLAS